MRITLATFVAVLLSVASPGAQTKAETLEKPSRLLENTYQCTGVLDGKKYTTALSIETEGDNYFLAWGDNDQLGLGVRTGDTLSVVLSSRAKTKEGKEAYVPIGVLAYDIGQGVLSGKWAFGDGKTYAETCSHSYSPNG